MRCGDGLASVPDGTRAVTASQDKAALVWDAATGKPLTGALEHQGWLVSAAFSPDGTRVVTASEDNTARVWDVATGRPLTGALEHQGRVVSAAFSRVAPAFAIAKLPSATEGRAINFLTWASATGRTAACLPPRGEHTTRSPATSLSTPLTRSCFWTNFAFPLGLSSFIRKEGRVQENRQKYQGMVNRPFGLSIPPFLWLALLAWFSPSPRVANAGPSGVDWIASGKVTDTESRHPVLGALLRCRRPDGRALAPIGATASGTFRVGPSDTRGVSYLRCEFSADGYEGVQLTVSGSNGSSELQVTMRRRRGLRITDMTVLAATAPASSTGAKDQLQFFVKNETDQKIVVQSLQLSVRVKVGDCLDLSPGFVLSIDQGSSKDFPLIGRLTAEGVKEPLDVPVTGTIAELPCHQLEASLLMKVLFAVDPKEHRKLAFALPRSFTLAKGMREEFSLVRATNITLDFKSGDTVLATGSLSR